MKVTKRDGSLEEYSVEKIHKIVERSVEGLSNVSMSDIEMNASISVYEGISTTDIHKLLVKSANELISVEAPNYQYVASRLLNIHLRKVVWGSGEVPCEFLGLIQVNADKGIYSEDILKKWSADQIRTFEQYIKHERDFQFTYAGLQQMVDKYLAKNRFTEEIFETPQFAYMLIAMCLFDSEQEVKKAYDCYSKFLLSLPTPIMAGVRTPKKQVSSCVLVNVGDDLDSIFASVHAVGKYTANRAGIGLNIGKIRPLNSKIRGGEVIHTGLIPYLKLFESAVKSTSQNGLRGGGATVNIPFWHYEIEDVLVLKNNGGTDDNRVRRLDYSINFNKLFYDRFIANENITLFSPHECPEIYDSFYSDKEFKEIYEKCERKTSLEFKKSIPARKLAEVYARERLETGRIYSLNVDNVQNHSSWNIPVEMSNLCQEILHPTKPINSIDDTEGEIGICILSAVNLLSCEKDSDLKTACEIAIKSLEAVIEYQDYPVFAGENFTKNRRSLGVGVTNLAGYLAKNKVQWGSPESTRLTHEVMERFQYYLLEASCDLAKNLGSCDKFSDTKYSKGLLPIDWYCKDVDNIIKPKYNMDWESLRNRIKEHGLRHSTVSAIMPCESSSVVQNSTNGIEPIRDVLTHKKAKNGVLKQLVPHVSKKKHYQKCWDITNSDIIKNAAVVQKFVDMGMSLNLYYDYEKYDNGTVPLSVVLKDQLESYKYGIKTLYYAVTNDSDGNFGADLISCESGACSI